MNKILCTGNPDHQTVASGVRVVFPDADFACRQTGYDLRMWSQESEKHFRDHIRQYNVLINSSFISNGAQQKILEIAREEWTCGHVINIGSTAEYQGRHSDIPQTYCIQKRALRDLSISLNSHKFKTTHITAGGLNDGKIGHEDWLDVIEVAKIIKFVLESSVSIPIIGIEKV
jgi:hypothetical protein